MASDQRAEEELRRFEPPFCPRPTCPHHLDPAPQAGWWEHRGLRVIQRAPGLVAQLRCRTCGRWFRSSVFGPDYWKKRAGLQPRVYALKANGCGQRQAARVLKVSPHTVRRRTRELARQALLIQLEQLARLGGRLQEDLVLDGLRDYAGSQYEPLDLHTPITAETRFVPLVNIAALRRSGAMTTRQRRIRAQREERLGRPEPQARKKRVLELLQRIAPLYPEGQSWTLRTDEEPDYARALAALPAGTSVRRRTVSSRQRRDGLNPLQPVNTLHGYMRHAQRELVRETIAFAKTAAGLLDRAWIFLLVRNYTKGRSERRVAAARQTPAMRLGLADRPLDGEALFAQRRFPRRVGLPKELVPAYLGTFRARPRENVKPYLYRYVA